ncbi:MAG: BON domain-containing protein [Acidobacteriia bacterium]|nr:BON domain-containing protein [Terriglobia bacterium]
MWNDTELQHDVEAEVGWELSSGPRHINTMVKGGAVELVGQVDTYWEKCAAERAVWRVAHVSTVTNGLRVVIPFEALREDDDIALSAMSILEWNGLLPSTIEVKVVDAWVTLSGTVQRHEQSEEAVRTLCTLRGITGIRNDIVIQATALHANAKAPIDAALRRNALVDSTRIKAQLVNGMPSLRGTARSRAEYDEAMHAAWAAPGTTSVEDHLIIGTL